MLAGKNNSRISINHTQKLVLGFMVIIAVGAFLLTLPISSASGNPTDFMTSLFTSVSATCVTGLIRVDTALHWSFFGQAVIIVLIQIGGVGFMTLAVMLLKSFKRRISITDRMAVVNSYSLSGPVNIMHLVKRIVKGTVIAEALGTVILSIRFIPLFGFWNGVWKSVFHSISAFCNAGFDIMGDFSGEFSSLSYFHTDPLVSLTVSGLIIVGGIGFVVWQDIYAMIKSKKRLYTYTKLVITVTLILLIGGTLWIMAFEWNNPDTIGNLSFTGKITASFFQSVTTRTAGFSSVNLCNMNDITKLVFLFLMFVGGSSGSTAGGIKTATIGVVICTVYSVIRGRKRTVIFKRTIPPEEVHRSFALVSIQFIIVLFGTIVLMAQNIDFMSSLFESFSALATVGLSLAVTPLLENISCVIIMAMMFFGRVGILTFAYALKKKAIESGNGVTYAESHLMIG